MRTADNAIGSNTSAGRQRIAVSRVDRRRRLTINRPQKTTASTQKGASGISDSLGASHSSSGYWRILASDLGISTQNDSPSGVSDTAATHPANASPMVFNVPALEALGSWNNAAVSAAPETTRPRSTPP